MFDRTSFQSFKKSVIVFKDISTTHFATLQFSTGESLKCARLSTRLPSASFFGASRTTYTSAQRKETIKRKKTSLKSNLSTAKIASNKNPLVAMPDLSSKDLPSINNCSTSFLIRPGIATTQSILGNELSRITPISSYLAKVHLGFFRNQNQMRLESLILYKSAYLGIGRFPGHLDLGQKTHNKGEREK